MRCCVESHVWGTTEYCWFCQGWNSGRSYATCIFYIHVDSDQCICRQQTVSSMATPRRGPSPRRPNTTEDVYALRMKLDDVAGKLNVVQYNLSLAQGVLTDMDQSLKVSMLTWRTCCRFCGSRYCLLRGPLGSQTQWCSKRRTT